jgi:DnaK suppressor protein
VAHPPIRADVAQCQAARVALPGEYPKGFRTHCGKEELIVALTKTQVSKLERTLDKQYKSLLEEVRDALEHSENQQYVELIDRAPADSADQAMGDALADLNLAIIDRHVRELRDIEATKLDLAKGNVGTCLDCGADIGFERLLAYPTAKRCFACQQQHERTYAHEGNPTL